MRKSKDVTKEGSIGCRVFAIEHHVCAVDHARFSFPALTIFPQQRHRSQASLLDRHRLVMPRLELTGGDGPRRHHRGRALHPTSADHHARWMTNVMKPTWQASAKQLTVWEFCSTMA